MTIACCQCGALSTKAHMVIVPKNQNVLQTWIREYNLSLDVRPGVQYICKTHISDRSKKTISAFASSAAPSTSNSYFMEEDIKREQTEITQFVDPKQELDDEVSYDDFPFEMEQDSYETMQQDDSSYSYQQNNYEMDCQPTTTSATMHSGKIEDSFSTSNNTEASHFTQGFPELSDDQIMSFCVKTSSNLSGESSFECGMCPEKFFLSPDTQSVRQHLESKHLSTLKNFMSTGQAPLAPKAYTPLSPSTKAKADESLCKFLIKNGLPLKAVHDLNLEILTFNINSSYKLPSVNVLSEYFKDIAQRKTDTKHRAEDGPVTITFDTTTFENRHYLAFTVHYYVEKNQKKNTVFFREFKMTQNSANSVMSTIKNAMDESNIRLPITTVVTGKVEYEESLENMDSFRQVMVCFSENLNKFAEALIEHPVFVVTLKKLRDFITKFPANRKDWGRFKAYIVRKRIYGEYPEMDTGHWTKTLDFITKCLHMHRLFSEFTTANPHITYIEVEDNVNTVYLHSLLNLCKNAFKTMSESKSNLSDVIPAIAEISESLHITTSNQVVINAVNLLFNRLLRPFIQHSDIHRFAVFLHPLRNGSVAILNSEWDAIKKSLARHIAHREATDGAPISKTGRMISLPSYNENLTAEKEVSAFCTFIKRLSGVETEIVDWWSRHAARFPRLFKYAKEIYQIPACSIDAAYYLGEYGLLTYSLNEEEPSKRKMLLDASSELMENFRSKSELMCKQICVKRKRESNYPGDMWFNPVDLKAIQSCDPFEPTIIRKPELPKQSGITVPNISSMPLYNNRM
ncbi:hypothetical protein CAEBREN_32052 [Caenorhabditis brenneri]|uniref:HAT C-terminal dimerisation domain-containing protein n=1 Tax=Caenorhabditis brenneri TaxID=135651 RepID=G0MXY4_CAEBE|nr:hypothetical protein CAEBREN_32052 [Caenorhabditis brenneri]